MTDHDLDRAIDNYYDYAPCFIECSQCKEMFHDDTIYKSKHDEDVVFCSEECCEEFETNREQEEIA